MSQFSEEWFMEEVQPRVKKIARIRFPKHPDLETLTADALSLAWQANRRAPARATALKIAQFAVKRAAIGRQFKQSIRSYEGPPSKSCRKPERVEFKPEELGSTKDDPAVVAAFRLDFAAWRETLGYKRPIMEALAVGELTCDTAEMFHLSPGRIAQIRTELKIDWELFTS